MKALPLEPVPYAGAQLKVVRRIGISAPFRIRHNDCQVVTADLDGCGGLPRIIRVDPLHP